MAGSPVVRLTTNQYDDVRHWLKGVENKDATGAVTSAFTYTRQVVQPDGTFQTVTTTHVCEGTRRYNGFYGDGIVDAERILIGR